MIGRSLAVLLALIVGTVPGVAQAKPEAPFSERAADWVEAAGTLGTAGALAEPGFTAGLSQVGGVSVVADGLVFGADRSVAGGTAAAARYGKGRRSIEIAQKWASTGWAAEPAIESSSAKVGAARVRGARAAVFANCWTGRDQPVPPGFRCTRADVLRSGGMLRTTIGSGAMATTIVIQTTGLTYDQLLRVARGLSTTGPGTGVAGSAQMLAMCAQMVNGRMSADAAGAFAQSLGYLLRVGSIDGQPQAVTMDYRWNRFTVSLVSGAVTACTYG